MARIVGSTNREPPRTPETVQYSTEQKLDFIANLIVDRILEDQAKGQRLLDEIRRDNNGAASTATA